MMQWIFFLDCLLKLSSGVDMSSCWRLATEGNKIAVRRFYHQHFLHRNMSVMDDGTQFGFIIGDQLYWTGLTRLRQFQACEVAANGEKRISLRYDHSLIISQWMRISLWDNHPMIIIIMIFTLWENHPMIFIMMIIHMMITWVWVCFDFGNIRFKYFSYVLESPIK